MTDNEVEYGRVYQHIGKSKQEAGNFDNNHGIIEVEVCVGMIAQEASLFMMIQVGTNELRSRKDPILSKVLRYTKSGWPATVPDELKPFYLRRMELTVEAGCLLWGMRVIVPKHLQQIVLKELHLSHPGVSRMKSIARSYLWWPGLDKEIEKLVATCTACQAVRQAPAAAPLHPWIWPTKP